MTPHNPSDYLNTYSLLDALRGRRSRRFGVGMQIPEGPFAYESRRPPLPLSEGEEAALVYAAAGINGYALLDTAFGPMRGGSMLVQSVGRTVASGDAIQSVMLFVTNDAATYYIKRPQDMTSDEIAELVELSRAGDLLEIYRRMRVKIKDGRAAPSVKPPVNIALNESALYAPGGTYFLPVNDMTPLYINGALEMFEKRNGWFFRDERNNFLPAGIGRWARSRGGHLEDNLLKGLTAPISHVETVLTEALTVEMGMMLQNMNLMGQALGLGVWPNFSQHLSGWFEALGFRMGKMKATKFLGANAVISAVLGLVGQDPEITYPLGLEIDNKPLVKPYCPPYYPTMRDAVLAFVESKFGPQGGFRGRLETASSWLNPGEQSQKIQGHPKEVIEAAIDFCTYVYERYGRFPTYNAAYHTAIGLQATHVDVDFYDKFYRPEALTETQREHLARWHNL